MQQALLIALPALASPEQSMPCLAGRRWPSKSSNGMTGTSSRSRAACASALRTRSPKRLRTRSHKRLLCNPLIPDFLSPPEIATPLRRRWTTSSAAALRAIPRRLRSTPTRLHSYSIVTAVRPICSTPYASLRSPRVHKLRSRLLRSGTASAAICTDFCGASAVCAEGDSDSIQIEGIEKFCADLKVDPTKDIVLVIAWQMNAETMGVFTREEWTHGMTAMGPMRQIGEVRQNMAA